MLDIREQYFKWLCDLVYSSERVNKWSYYKLFRTLSEVEFFYIHPLDENRAIDGVDFRHRFAYEHGYSYGDVDEVFTNEPCSMLEMMVALAHRCEETIMHCDEFGDRTAQWFWSMISSLGLGNMTDDNYDHSYVCDILERLLERRYSADGAGSLFYIPGCKVDLRKLDIWYQMNTYLIYIEEPEENYEDW